MRVASPEYRCQLLLSSYFLQQTGQRSTPVKVLEILRAFREEFHRHQTPLVAVINQHRTGKIDTSYMFDVCQSTGLCPDVVIEIARYLSLHDIVNAFSMSILPLLRQAHIKVHLVNPPKLFLETIRTHLDPSQITSLRFDADLLTWARNFSLFQVFDRLISLAVVNGSELCLTGYLLDQLPNVQSLSLWFDGGFNFDGLRSVRSLPSSSITRLHIRCEDYIWIHSPRNCRRMRYQHPPNPKITSFIFDSPQYRLPDGNGYRRRNSPEVFILPMEFLQSLINVQHVRYRTNRFRIETLLEIEHWKKLLDKCTHLERVTIQVMDPLEFTEQVRGIEEELREFRPGMIFRIAPL